MVTITRRLEFDAGHRILGHESKCAHLHGHRYRAELTVTADDLDKLGRVIDFGVVKKIVGAWIDDNWDHNMILNAADPLAELYDFKEGETDVPALQEMAREVFGGKVPFVMPVNPTAENMAHVLYQKAKLLLKDHPIHVIGLRLYETPNSWAEIAECVPS